MNFFEAYKSIYQKQKLYPEADWQLCIVLNKWLGFEKSNVGIIKSLLPYMFYVEPKHYFYLLFFNIPKRWDIPYHKKIAKIKTKQNRLLDKIQYVLGWSNREVKFNKAILDKVILNNSKYWKKELGVGQVKR